MNNTYILKVSDNSYRVRFYNPIDIKLVDIGNTNTYEEAMIMYNNYETNFYKDKRYMLPKSIHLNKRNNRLKFTVHFNIKMKYKYKSVYIGDYDTLDQAIEAKSEFITNII